MGTSGIQDDTALCLAMEHMQEPDDRTREAVQVRLQDETSLKLFFDFVPTVILADRVLLEEGLRNSDGELTWP